MPRRLVDLLDVKSRPLRLSSLEMSTKRNQGSAGSQRVTRDYQKGVDRFGRNVHVYGNDEVVVLPGQKRGPVAVGMEDMKDRPGASPRSSRGPLEGAALTGWLDQLLKGRK